MDVLDENLYAIKKNVDGVMKVMHIIKEGMRATMEDVYAIRKDIPVADEDMSEIKKHMHAINVEVSSLMRHYDEILNDDYYRMRTDTDIQYEMDEMKSSMDAIKKWVTKVEQNEVTRHGRIPNLCSDVQHVANLASQVMRVCAGILPQGLANESYYSNPPTRFSSIISNESSQHFTSVSHGFHYLHSTGRNLTADRADEIIFYHDKAAQFDTLRKLLDALQKGQELLRTSPLVKSFLPDEAHIVDNYRLYFEAFQVDFKVHKLHCWVHPYYFFVKFNPLDTFPELTNKNCVYPDVDSFPKWSRHLNETAEMMKARLGIN
jgi:hypothetical protein